jgi:1-aminocyclopropane-1-carboxylate deaminase
LIHYTPIIQNLKNEHSHQLDILRLDLIDSEISGNKWFKLKKNLEKAIFESKKLIITHGGAFSNHIAATAAACKKYNLKCVGVIRGDETDELNSTLSLAKENGMMLYFVNRETYAKKNTEEFKKHLQEKFGEYYLIPEGGNNEEGVKGCFEIVKREWDYDYVVCACGTATTYAGILASKKENQIIIGISVLKGENKLPSETQALLQKITLNKTSIISNNQALQKETLEENCILNSYSFNGYAKFNQQLVDFKNNFENTYGIILDHIYTTKLLFGIYDLINQKKLRPNTSILVIHSGGLQGNDAFDQRYHLSPKR